MAHPHEHLNAHPHDRLHERRKEDAWLEERWADPQTRVLVVSGTRIRPHEGRVAWVSPTQAPQGLRVLLGRVAGRTWFALVTGPETARAATQEWVPLRGLLAGLAAGPTSHEPALVLHALGLAEWLAVTRFCPRCAEPLTPRAAGHELACAQGHTQFPRTDAAVIMLVLHGVPGSEDERCLLGRQAVWPEGRFSTLAGFYEPGETLEDAVRREVREEVGIEVGQVSYFGNQPWPLPASLMIGMVAQATSTQIDVDRDEIEEARWFTRAQMRQQAESGQVVLPGGISISRSLIEHWYGDSLPGQW
ncbi:MAG: NAD(+) diphosphatase [Nocardioides sp.]|nr:NAD(+) diphosphatase [Nocardioides sp.]